MPVVSLPWRLAALSCLRSAGLLRETAREGPDVTGWRQRSPPCPRHIRELNVTELCCQPLPATADAEEEARHRAPQSISYRELTNAELEVGEAA